MPGSLSRVLLHSRCIPWFRLKFPAACLPAVCWEGDLDDPESQVSPRALSQVERQQQQQQRLFLTGRPGVPRLELSKLPSADAEAAAPAAQPAEPGAVAALAGRPPVPLLALSKLNPGAGASRKAGVVQASRVPAANFSTMDRSPSKAYSGEHKGCSSSACTC